MKEAETSPDAASVHPAASSRRQTGDRSSGVRRAAPETPAASAAPATSFAPAAPATPAAPAAASPAPAVPPMPAALPASAAPAAAAASAPPPAPAHGWTPSQFKPHDYASMRAMRHETASTSASAANKERNVREYTLGEEIANSVTHGLGALLAIAAIPVLVVRSLDSGGGVYLFAALVYTLTMLLEYTMSTLYHAIAQDKAKRVFKVLDRTRRSASSRSLRTAAGGCARSCGRSRWRAWRARRSGCSDRAGYPLCCTCFWVGASWGFCRRFWRPFRRRVCGCSWRVACATPSGASSTC